MIFPKCSQKVSFCDIYLYVIYIYQQDLGGLPISELTLLSILDPKYGSFLPKSHTIHYHYKSLLMKLTTKSIYSNSGGTSCRLCKTYLQNLGISIHYFEYFFASDRKLHRLQDSYIRSYIEIFFKNWDSLHARLNSHYKGRIYKISTKKIKAYQKPLRCLLILDLKLFRSQFKEKHSIAREFQIRAVRGKKLLNKYQNNEQTLLEKKWKKLSQFR